MRLIFHSEIIRFSEILETFLHRKWIIFLAFLPRALSGILLLHFSLQVFPMAQSSFCISLKLNSFFQTFAFNSFQGSRLILPFPLPSNSCISNIVFSFKSLISVLSELSNWKAHGSDGIPSVIFKFCDLVLTSYHSKLLRLFLFTSIFPTCWMRARPNLTHVLF